MTSLASRIGSKARLLWDIVDPTALGTYRRLSRPVDGWLTRREEATLFELAGEVPNDQCIVELGSWFGRSAILLGGGSSHGRGAKVFAVDLFTATGFAKEVLEQRAGDAARDFLAQFQKNINDAALANTVVPIRSATSELGNRWTGPPVGLLFIDADHSYEGVRSDWMSWRGRLAAQARVAFHDYRNPAFEGVTQFVQELIARCEFNSVQIYDSIASGKVTDGAPAR